eukprot:11743212-Karenia_brevis.AAC.1
MGALSPLSFKSCSQDCTLKSSLTHHGLRSLSTISVANQCCVSSHSATIHMFDSTAHVKLPIFGHGSRQMEPL